MARQKPELDSEDFKKLLTSFDSDEAKALEKYQVLRDKLVRHCFKAHEFFAADDLADDAFDVLTDKLRSEQIQNIESYAFKILDNKLANHRRKRPTAALPEDLAAQNNPEQAVIEKMDGEHKFECFRRCMKRLKPLEQWLVFEYYPNEGLDLEERRQKIAIKLGIEPGALTTRMNRLRAKLEACCKNCYRGGFGSMRLWPGSHS